MKKNNRSFNVVFASLLLFIPAGVATAANDGTELLPYTTDGTLSEVTAARLTTSDTYNLVTGSGRYSATTAAIEIGGATATNAHLTVSSGGDVVASYSSGTGGSVYVGYGTPGTASYGCSNSLTITGSGSTVTTGYGPNYIGFYGSSNTLLIERGGSFSGSGTNVQVTIGNGDSTSSSYGNSNAVTVTGLGSTLSIVNAALNAMITVGNYGSSNSMTISDSGAVTSNVFLIGGGSNTSSTLGTASSNHVTVTGSGSSLTVSSATVTTNNFGSISVGRMGRGNYMEVLSGADVSSRNFYVGSYFQGSSNTMGNNNYAKLSGSGSTLTVTSILKVGFTSSASVSNSDNYLEIDDGALVKVGSSSSAATVTVISGNYIELANGVLAIYSNVTSSLSTMLEGKVKTWDGDSFESVALTSLNYAYCSSTAEVDEFISKYDLSSYDYTAADLVGYTLITGGSAISVPEPSTYALFGGVGALGLALYRRRSAKIVA